MSLEDAFVARYMALDSSVRSRISLHEFAWMGDREKHTLETTETEPEF